MCCQRILLVLCCISIACGSNHLNRNRPQITNAIRPDVIFSAHLHISRTLTYPPMHLNRFEDSAVHQFQLRDSAATTAAAAKSRGHRGRDDHKYLEIAVPTCSYRMGVANSGFGMAVIGESERHTRMGLGGINMVARI